MDMRAAAHTCLESLESLVLELEDAASTASPEAPALRQRIFKALGLRDLEGCAGEAMLLLDMVEDGVVPVDPALIDAMLHLVEGQRRVFFHIADALAGPARKPSQADVAPSLSPQTLQAPQSGPAPRAVSPNDADSAAAMEAVLASHEETPAGNAQAADASVEDAPAGAVSTERGQGAALSGTLKDHAGATEPAGAGAASLAAVSNLPGAGRRESAAFLKVDTVKLDELMESVKELLITNTVIVQHPAMLGEAMKELYATVLAQNRVIQDLRDHVVDIRRVAVSGLFNRMGRLARETAHGEGKRVEVRLEGQEAELDKSMLDLLGDPMTHLVRNAVDHGLEPPADRVEAGKDPVGVVTFAAREEGGEVVIEIRDDGRGLDRTRILEKAREKGLLEGKAGETMSDEAIYGLILKPGFSTADKATALSGRGVGMDVVAQAILAMRGELEIASTAGAGSVFTIRAPANHAATEGIASGLEVVVAGQHFVIPAKHVVEILRPGPHEVASMVNQGEVISVRGKTYPMARMAFVFQLDCRLHDPKRCLALLVESGGRRKALLVDDVVGEQQVVVRTFEGFSKLFDVSLFSGMALIGDKISVVVNLEAFFVESDRDNRHAWCSFNICNTPRSATDAVCAPKEDDHACA